MKTWHERPKCNIVPGCDKPSVVMVADRFCCGDHLVKWHEKRQEQLRQQFEGL